MPAPAVTGSASRVTRSIEVDAPAETVWRLVSDLPSMGRLSPENRGGRWLAGADGPALGARFRGANRQRWRRWSTRVEVTECEPARRFGFEVSSLGLRVSKWSYDVTARPDGGCTVAETWEDRGGAVMHVLGPLVSGVGDRAEFTARSIEETLAALKRQAEMAA